VPGDARPGAHRVTSSCTATPRSPRSATTFLVTRASAHRSAFATSLNQPRQVPTDPARLGTSAVGAVCLLLLLAFPSELFNSTLEENYDEIRRWFRVRPRPPPDGPPRAQALRFVALILVGALVYALLSPDVGLDAASLALVVGLTVALALMSVLFGLPATILVHRQVGEWGRLNVLPGSIAVAAVCVGLSRLLHFQPGYLYGVLAGFAFRSRIDDKQAGRYTAWNNLVALVVCGLAWWARVPVSAAAARPGAGVWLYALEACLVAVFLLGIESVAVGLLPMRFLDGRKVAGWSRAAWVALFGLALFAVVHVLLVPGSGYVNRTSNATELSVVLLYAAFGLASVAFWAYFRFRVREDQVEPMRLG